MIKSKKSIKNLVIVMLSAIVLLAGCGQSSTSSNSSSTNQKNKERVVTDSTGAKVTIPNKVNRIAEAWPAHDEITTMLSERGKIVATSSTPKSVPWLYKVSSSMKNAQTIFTNTTVNTEGLEKAKPDVLFTSNNPVLLSKTKDLGIPTVQLIFQNYDDLKKVVNITAQTLGGNAQAKADKFNSYLDTRLNSVKSVTSKIPDSQKPKVLHIQSLNPLVIDGKDTIVDQWIQYAGGKDAAEISGNKKPASIEQILKWNPDVIIMGNNNKLSQVYNNPQWSQINAVKNKKVYINPAGAFLWDRYGAEVALQFQWAAKLLHPNQFKDLDMIKETQNFYKEFLNYNLTDDEANKILNAQSPGK